MVLSEIFFHRGQAALHVEILRIAPPRQRRQGEIAGRVLRGQRHQFAELVLGLVELQAVHQRDAAVVALVRPGAQDEGPRGGVEVHQGRPEPVVGGGKVCGAGAERARQEERKGE